MCELCTSPFTTSSTGATSCDACEKGSYLDQAGTCRSCPEGVKCDKPARLETLELEPGYFRATPESEQVYWCMLGKAACAGGSRTGGELCDKGYKSVLCSKCEAGYFFDSLTRICRNCQSSRVTPAMVVVSVVVLMVVVGLVCMKDQAQSWSKKWLNMGKVRIVYTTCQVGREMLIP